MMNAAILTRLSQHVVKVALATMLVKHGRRTTKNSATSSFKSRVDTALI